MARDFSRGPFTIRSMWNSKAVLGGDFDRGADLHRIRRHLDAVRGGGESAAQYFAGDGADLFCHRNTFCARSLCRAAGLAGLSAVSQQSTLRLLFVAGRAWKPLFAIRGLHAARRELWLRDGRADRRGAAAVWHGTQQGAAAEILRRGRCQAARPRNNVLFVGAIALLGAVAGEFRHCSATGWARKC